MSVNIKDKLTIVIPTYNEEKYIGTTLENLYEQSGIDGVNVIIADANSTDQTRIIVERYQTKFEPTLKIRLIDGGKVAYGRNMGSRYVFTKYVLFLDADSQLLSKDNILYNINLMEQRDLDLLTCKIKSVGKDFRTNIAFNIFNVINKILSLHTPFAIGGYFMTKIYKFRGFGMFNEELNNSEDYWLSRHYNPKNFHISKMKYGQDDRRFKKMGYIKMLKLIILNHINRNNIDYFKKDVGYW
jgi:glycosyltransferase involved in cell wall biosynthesis